MGADAIDIDNKRVIIEAVTPAVDGGRFPVKRVVGDLVGVEADAYTDGHDVIVCQLLYREGREKSWRRTMMQALGNDRWRGTFRAEQLGRYVYTVVAWADAFLTWRGALAKRKAAGQDLLPEFRIGALLMAACATRAGGADRQALLSAAALLDGDAAADEKYALAHQESLAQLASRYRDQEPTSRAGRDFEVVVDCERAGCSAWYEMFPRSASDSPQHGTLRDCLERLPYVARMGFDVLYLPPIHPIGRAHRKGRNNALDAGSEDVGSPWAIGAREGGHKAIHPALGTFNDFQALVEQARGYGIAIALDIAFQCSPDHPYVREHPEWFRRRPDGSVQYAENPPKKYEDIYPFDFECSDWRALYAELKSVFEFWISHGVHIFRVDNPHTKPFPFWAWVIAELKREHPELILLAEAFTRPKVMRRLAKLGYTQSYTYFTWRNTRAELTEYFTELTQTDMREYFRPNAWPNTPDILHEYLQNGGRPAFMIRLVLAATLCANYGIYGPAFEHCENRPREPGSEEYLDSEKYEIRSWNLERADSLADLIARVNRSRRENRALQRNDNLRFHETENPELIAYSKATADLDNVVVMVVNLDPHHVQSGWVHLPLELLGVEEEQQYQMHDLLSGARYLWHGPRNFVQLDPGTLPAHLFALKRRVKNEHDFDYFM